MRLLPLSLPWIVHCLRCVFRFVHKWKGLRRKPHPTRKGNKMNSKELGLVIQIERERLEELAIAVSLQQRKIAELVAQKIRLDNDEADHSLLIAITKMKNNEAIS